MNGERLKPESLHSKPASSVLADEETLERGCDVDGHEGVCVCDVMGHACLRMCV